MWTIPKYVQQYQTSVTIGLVRYYGLLFQMLQRDPTAAISQKHLLSLISLLLPTSARHSSRIETFKLHNTHFILFCFFFSLLLNQNRTYAPTTTFWNNVGRTRRKRIVPDNLAISKRTMCWKGGANINNKIAAPSQQTSPIYFINWWSYHVICKSFELLGLIRKERQLSGPGSAWDFRQMSTLWEETMPQFWKVLLIRFLEPNWKL